MLNERLIKEDILTSLFVKKHVIVRYNTKKYGEEQFVSVFPYSNQKKFPHLDKEGIVKVGSEVKENDILVGKITPEPGLRQETEEEKLLRSILGEKAQRGGNIIVDLRDAVQVHRRCCGFGSSRHVDY